MQKASAVTDKSFKEEVLESGIPVLVDFWASWCPPCKMMEPVIDELGGEYGTEIKIAKLNVDRNPETAARFSVRGVPTFMLFKSARIIAEETGVRSKEQMRKMIEDAI